MKKKNSYFKGITYIFLFLLLLLTTNQSYSQQSNTEQLSLSIGASAGYVPILSFGNVEDSGAIVGISGDLQYQNVIGQLDYVYVIAETVSSEYFTNGMGFFGSLGYKLVASDKFHIPVMATVGASIIEYEPFSSYKDVSPQIGVTIAPQYILNQGMSIYGAFRYMHGFKGSEESTAIDVMGITVGFRFTLL